MFAETDITTLAFNPFEKIGKDWALLAAGDKEKFNSMTISWGYMGVMFNKPVFTTVVRPQRYTKEFIDNGDLFTISFFEKDYKKTLSFLGSNSGRDVDKQNVEGLTPDFSDGVVKFEEASLVLVCKKLFAMEMKPEDFFDKDVALQNYPNKDFHTFYTGEIIKAYRKVD